MFCALNGTTRVPLRDKSRQIPATMRLFPTSEPVPRMARALAGVLEFVMSYSYAVGFMVSMPTHIPAKPFCDCCLNYPSDEFTKNRVGSTVLHGRSTPTHNHDRICSGSSRP